MLDLHCICSRYEGPTLNGVLPIVTVFDNISQKALLWTKIKENVKNSAVVVTQFDGSKLDKKKQKENGLFMFLRILRVLNANIFDPQTFSRTNVFFPGERIRSPVKSKVIRREQPQRKSRSVSPVKSNKVKTPEILPSTSPTFPDPKPVMSSAPSPR